MSRSLRGLSQEGVREALSRNPRLRWVAKTVLRPLIDRLLPQISAAQNENLLPKVEPILFHYMMVSLTATLSGFGTEMEVISNLSPGESSKPTHAVFGLPTLKRNLHNGHLFVFAPCPVRDRK